MIDPPKYTFVAYNNIADMLVMPWGEFFLTMASAKKDVYENNERAAFYLPSKVDNKLLLKFFKDFYKNIRVLDIPNYFVLVCVPSQQEADIVMQAYEAIGADHEPTIHIEPLLRTAPAVESSSTTFDLPDTVCPMPWNSLDVNSLGEFAPCCFFRGAILDENGKAYHPNTSTLEEVYNSEHMKVLRKQFRNGVKPTGCFRCWKEEESGTVSKRQMYAGRFGNDSKAINWDEDDIRNLKMLSVSFGNVCNFKCRICSSKSSSKIAAEEQNDAILKKGQWIRSSEHLWDQVIANPQLRYFDFAGGEPLLDKDHLKALRYMIDANIAQEVTLHYNTNGSIITDELLEVWTHFKSVDLAVSIDDIGERFNYQRPGLGQKWNWDLVEQNVKYIKQNKSSNVQLSLHGAVSILNVYYLPELFEWIDLIGFDDVHFSVLYNPKHLSLTNIPKSVAQVVLTKLTSSGYRAKYDKFMNPVLHELRNTKTETNQTFVDYMQRLDALRNESFDKTLPEIAVAFV